MVGEFRKYFVPDIFFSIIHIGGQTEKAEDATIVFYPCAKVQMEAYTLAMYLIAREGDD